MVDIRSLAGTKSGDLRSNTSLGQETGENEGNSFCRERGLSRSVIAIGTLSATRPGQVAQDPSLLTVPL